MSFRNYITSWLRTRSMQLQIEAAAAGRPVPDQAEAERLAAQEVARAQRRSPTRLPHAPEHITVANAGAELWRRIEQVAARLREPFTPGSSAPVVVTKSSSVDPLGTLVAPTTVARITKATETASPPVNQIVGIYTGKGAASKLIEDSEYHTSLYDHVTDNWRRSIAANEKRAKEQGGRSHHPRRDSPRHVSRALA